MGEYGCGASTTDFMEEVMEISAMNGSVQAYAQQAAQSAPAAARNEPPPPEPARTANEAVPGQNAYGGGIDVRA